MSEHCSSLLSLPVLRSWCWPPWLSSGQSLASQTTKRPHKESSSEYSSVTSPGWTHTNAHKQWHIVYQSQMELNNPMLFHTMLPIAKIRRQQRVLPWVHAWRCRMFCLQLWRTAGSFQQNTLVPELPGFWNMQTSEWTHQMETQPEGTAGIHSYTTSKTIQLFSLYLMCWMLRRNHCTCIMIPLSLYSACRPWDNLSTYTYRKHSD